MKFSRQRLGTLIDKVSQLRVLVVGDVMVDSYITGKVERISPEAPVPVVNVKSRELRLGGAANVALNVKSMGATPVLVSLVGNDESGHQFRELIKEEGITESGILLSKNRRTTLKSRVMSGTQQLLRFDEEDTGELEEIDRKALIGHLQNMMADCDLVIVEDYDKGCLDKEVISALIQSAKAERKFVAVDPKKKNFHHYREVDLFKPNLRELCEGLEEEVDPTSTYDLIRATDKLFDSIAFKNALITLSSEGIFYTGEDTGNQPAALRNISDVSGAGDTVIAVASMAMVGGLSLAEAAALANAAGGLVCEVPGVVPINCEQLIKEVTA